MSSEILVILIYLLNILNDTGLQPPKVETFLLVQCA
jgi:hypothetical protein